MAKDPICGMDVDEKTAEHTAEHMGETYYFCASGCKKAFKEDPGKYMKGEAKMEMHEHEKKPWWRIW